MKKHITLAALLPFTVAALFSTGCGGRDAGHELVLYGNVDIRQVSLAFDGSGRIAEMRAEEGDLVKAGDIVATLDTRTLELQAEQAAANLAAHQQTLLRLQNGSRPEEIELARAKVASAESDVSRAEQDYTRAVELLKGNAMSKQETDLAKNAAEVARAKATEMRASLQLAELGPREEDVAAAEAQLNAAKAQLALLQHQIALGTLRAPTDAVVRSRLREPGDMVTPQQPVFALALTRPKWARVYVKEADLGKIKPGMEARLTTDSHPATPINGTIGYISSVAEFTPKPVQTEELRSSLVYEVRVVVDDTADTLRLGQPVTVHIPVVPLP